MITGINKLTKHILCKCKCIFDEKKNVFQINTGIMINVNVSIKKFMFVIKIMFGILLHLIVEMENI